jgi:vancomycin resistance protein YoaR
MGVNMKIKSLLMTFALAGSIFGALLIPHSTVSAAEYEPTINKGVLIGDLDLSGKTAEEAKAEVEAYIEEERAKNVTFQIAEHEVEATVGELGITWTNTDVVDKAALIGNTGNIVQKYKVLKDLQQEPIQLPLDYSLEKEAIERVVNEKCLEFDVEPSNASLTRENGQFVVHESTKGLQLNVEESVEEIINYMENTWTKGDAVIPLSVVETEPDYNGEDLKQVKDVLGTFSTDFSSSTASRAQNLDNGAAKINGSLVYPGEVFSVYEVTHPFTEENGYGYGSAFENGKVVPSLGGGICQVSTTLYNSVLLSELEVVERSNHTMIVTYVKPSMDAAIAGTHMDLKFRNNTDTPIYIEGYTQNRQITFTIYGHETRAEGRTVRYESETTGNTPAGVKLEASDAPIGSFSQIQSAHNGSTAVLWKVVTENGQETRTKVNSSTYVASPTIYSVGTASSDPAKSAAMREAVASGDYSHAQSVAASLLAQSDTPKETETQPEETAAPEQGDETPVTPPDQLVDPPEED